MALVGNELLYVLGLDALGRPAATQEATTVQQVAGAQRGGTNASFTTISTASPVTLTGAQVGAAPDVTILLTATLAAGGTLNLPTVAALAAALPSPSAATSLTLRIINDSSANFAWTVTTATGWTLSGTMTIAQNAFRDFVIQFASASTATLSTAGTGTYS